jgi:hypothetical protein
MESDDHTRPTHPNMCAQPEESLMRRLVIAISSQLTQSPTPGGTGKTTDRNRKTVNQRNIPLDNQILQQLLPKFFFDSPEVGRLTHESRSMPGLQRREKVCEVTTEVKVARLVLIQDQDFTDHFYRLRRGRNRAGVVSGSEGRPYLKCDATGCRLCWSPIPEATELHVERPMRSLTETNLKRIGWFAIYH